MTINSSDVTINTKRKQLCFVTYSVSAQEKLRLLSLVVGTGTGKDTRRKTPFSSYIPKMEFPLDVPSVYAEVSSTSKIAMTNLTKLNDKLLY